MINPNCVSSKEKRKGLKRCLLMLYKSGLRKKNKSNYPTRSILACVVVLFESLVNLSGSKIIHLSAACVDGRM